jgi:CelD/BcsL family acetyltransferase involved in cellulose biosynthesis
MTAARYVQENMPLVDIDYVRDSVHGSVHQGEVGLSGRKSRVAYCIDPLADWRWEELVQRHPRASLFHSTAWLKALRLTYNYPAVAYVTSAPGQRLESGMAFCQVESWLTGRRLVSLPFSDHCEPLVDSREDLDVITTAVEAEVRRGLWRYMETRSVRPLEIATALHPTTVPYTFHQLDLAPDIQTLFRNCHKNSTQRKILRAEREGLRYCEGSSEKLLDDFYRLLTITRRRHQRPPQPRKWFLNLIECFGDDLKIRVAQQGDRPVAAILTIRHKDTMTYKYGGSDTEFNALGGVHLLLWRTIQESKRAGMRWLDFGRSDADQPGLITFKSRWGAKQSELTYSRFSRSADAGHAFEASAANWKSRASGFLLSLMPPDLLSLAGRALYRHVG